MVSRCWRYQAILHAMYSRLPSRSVFLSFLPRAEIGIVAQLFNFNSITRLTCGDAKPRYKQHTQAPS